MKQTLLGEANWRKLRRGIGLGAVVPAAFLKSLGLWRLMPEMLIGSCKALMRMLFVPAFLVVTGVSSVQEYQNGI